MQINIPVGLREYDFNGKVTAEFNPTDPDFVERLYTVFNEIDALSEKHKGEADVFATARAINEEIRAKINGLFEKDICNPLFGNVNMLAMAEGLPLWCNLLLPLIDEIDSTHAAEKAKTNPRLESYIEKYKKR